MSSTDKDTVTVTFETQEIAWTVKEAYDGVIETMGLPSGQRVFEVTLPATSEVLKAVN